MRVAAVYDAHGIVRALEPVLGDVEREEVDEVVFGGGLRVVNAGSAGMPYQGDVGAFRAILDVGAPSFRRTPFDLECSFAEIGASSWPGPAAFVAENLLVPASQDEAIAELESRRAG